MHAAHADCFRRSGTGIIQEEVRQVKGILMNELLKVLGAIKSVRLMSVLNK